MLDRQASSDRTHNLLRWTMLDGQRQIALRDLSTKTGEDPEIQKLEKRIRLLDEKLSGIVVDMNNVKKFIENNGTFHDIVYCNSCGYLFQENEERFHCSEETNFDLCIKCMEKGVHSDHFLYPMDFNQQKAVEKLVTSKSFSQMLRSAFLTFSKRHCIGHRKQRQVASNEGQANWVLEESFTWFTYEEIFDMAIRLGSGLVTHFGIKKGDFVGICGENSILWILCDLACLLRGIVVVPLDTRLSSSEFEFVLNNAGIKVVIADEPLLENFIGIERSRIAKQLLGIVSFDKLASVRRDSLYVKDVQLSSQSLPSFDFLINLGSKSRNLPLNSLEDFKEDDIVTVIYTSGSTGKPKGAIYTNSIWLKNVGSYLWNDYDPYVTYSKDPMAHVSDREDVLDTFKFGGRVGVRSLVQNIFEDIKFLNPTRLSCTPRFYNVIYSEFRRACEEEKEEKKNQLKRELRPAEIETIRSKNIEHFKTILGNRIQDVSVGGAMSSQVVLDFLREVWGIKVEEGYGSTEAGAICSKGGRINATVEFKLVDVPDMGYYQTDLPFPRGELYVKTRTLIAGYYNNTEDTAANFDPEGWFKTGDIVALTAPQTIKIIDRRKNLFKLAQGEYLAPEKLENVFIENEFVHQIVVTCGKLSKFQNQTSPLAIVVPEKEILMRWWKQKCFEDVPYSQICASSASHLKILNEITQQGRKSNLKSYELPCLVLLEPERFTIENGRMTVSNKIARPVVLRSYEETIDSALTQYFNQKKETNDIEKNESQSIILAMKMMQNAIGGSDINGDVTENLFLKHGGDSLSAIRLRNIIQRETKIEVPIEMIYSPEFSVESLSTMLESKNQLSSDSNQSILEVLNNDAKLNEDIAPSWVSSPENNPTKVIFLTGSTGFLGIFILDELLQKNNGGIVVHCLIRSNNNESGMKRLKDSMKKLGVWKANRKYIKGESPSVIVVPGDLSSEQFGLHQEHFNYLAQNVDSIIHCGAYVNHIQPYAMHKAHNVVGTETIIRLACAGKRKVLQFVSSISVIAGVKKFVLKETDEINPNTSIEGSGGYSQSKWVAEMLVRQARSRGVPTNIFRPGLISWHSNLGACNLLDWFTRLIVGSISLGLFPEALPTGRTLPEVNLVPVDFVGSAIASVTLSNIENEYFHLINPDQTLWNDLREWISSFGKYALERQSNSENNALENIQEHMASFDQTITPQKWFKWVQSELDLAKQNQKQRRVEALSGLLLFSTGLPSDDDSSKFSQENTKKLLEPLGVECPDINQPNSLKLFLTFLVSSGQFEDAFR
eukprot:TRINITY_DN8476_c0_g2_i1.p1 TRINITY_DN8476_c0_g2~~TRINITY_DN8476_c0_g2_i1.p1  ORF type:complete len:1286 (+),score=275.14 TRINITY_DN8476_c0_g2_i1:294-4151(+)